MGVAETLVNVKNLSVAFRAGQEDVYAVKGASFRIGRGETVAFERIPALESFVRNGDFVVRVCDGALTPSFHGLDDQLRLTHMSGDDWRLDFTTVPGFDVPGWRPGANPDAQCTSGALPDRHSSEPRACRA